MYIGSRVYLSKKQFVPGFLPWALGEDVPCELLHSCTLKVTERGNENNELAATFLCCCRIWVPLKMHQGALWAMDPLWMELESSTFFESRKIKSTVVQAMWLKWNMVCNLYMFFFFFFWVGYQLLSSNSLHTILFYFIFNFHSAEMFWK
jgi:hypothetical protein